MIKCLFDKSTALLYVASARDVDIPHDDAIHVQVELNEFPDPRTQRWDGATGIRAATAQEVDDWDDAEADTAITGQFENNKLRRLVFEIEFDQENRIRVLEGKSVVTKTQYRDALVARFKAL